MVNLSETEANYRSGVRAAIRALWSGVYSDSEFVNLMTIAIRREFTFAWERGSSACNIKRSEWSDNELIALDTAINSELGFALRFMENINAHNKRSGGKLAPLMAHVDLWVNRLRELENRARIMACKDTKLIWVLGPTHEHCTDCARLTGRVKRASQWDASGWRPQSRDLACHGYNCLCRLIVTDAPLTKGALPKKPERQKI